MFFFTTTKDHRVLRSAAKGCFKEKKKILLVVTKIWGWLLVKNRKSFFSFFTREPAHLILSYPHFWERSQSEVERVCLCFVSGCSSPHVLTMNKSPKFPGICWYKEATELPCCDAWPAQPRLPGTRGLRQDPCCSQYSFEHCKNLLPAFLSGFLHFPPLLWASVVLSFLALRCLSKCFSAVDLSAIQASPSPHFCFQPPLSIFSGRVLT